jgi:hypothetical protein
LRIYENKSQILGGFDLWACKVGYDLDDGIFATLHGAFAIAAGCNPIDTSKRSTTYGARLQKYSQKGFSILFPGIKCDGSWDHIEASDGSISSVQSDGYTVNFYPHYTFESDYESGNTNINWWYFIHGRYELLSYETNDVDKILNAKGVFLLDDNEALAGPYNRSKIAEPTHVEHIFAPYDAVHPDEVLLKKFKMAYYVDRDIEKADEIWSKVKEWYEVETAKICKEQFGSLVWKIVDPGTQAFGSNNPVIKDPRDWYKEHYDPNEVGIPSDVYIVLRNCLRDSPQWSILNRDVFRIICGKLEIARAQDILKSYLQ